MAQHSRTRTELVAIPSDLVGTRAAVFFLLSRPKRRKLHIGFADRAANTPTRPSALEPRGRHYTKTLLLTDEFIFT